MTGLPQGCGYQGYEFGAGAYPDSMCCGGRLYDCDDCDNAGNLYEPTEYIPCPICHEKRYVRYWADRFENGGENRKKALADAKALTADIRRNRERGTEPWKTARS